MSKANISSYSCINLRNKNILGIVLNARKYKAEQDRQIHSTDRTYSGDTNEISCYLLSLRTKCYICC